MFEGLPTIPGSELGSRYLIVSSKGSTTVGVRPLAAFVANSKTEEILFCLGVRIRAVASSGKGNLSKEDLSKDYPHIKWTKVDSSRASKEMMQYLSKKDSPIALLKELVTKGRVPSVLVGIEELLGVELEHCDALKEGLYSSIYSALEPAGLKAEDAEGMVESSALPTYTPPKD